MDIENALYRLQRAAERSESQFGVWCYYAIARYVRTGRASRAWCDALCKASPDKLICRMVSGGLSDDELLASCTKYLSRYAGFRR